jgi:hypothetical protein
VWNDAGQTPNIMFAVLETGSVPVIFALSNLPERPGTKQPLTFEDTQSGYIVHCEGGSYRGRRGGGTAIDSAGKVIRDFKGTTGGREHYANFFDAMRSRDPQHLNADVVVGHDSTNWSHVINAAWRSADTAGFIPGDTLAGGESSAALERLLLDHVAAYGAAIPADALTLSQRLEIDGFREMFIGPGAEEANAFLGPREFRTPYVLESVPDPGEAFTPPAATVRSKP